MSAWILPDYISDALPIESSRIEFTRRNILDIAESYGYELVMPPMVEYLESLLSGSGKSLDAHTFRLVDQISGRMLGLRADTTPQVARIDSHLLNRSGVSRLCYCGLVLHTTPAGSSATRELLQFGAEIYGYGGVGADLEILALAIDCIKSLGMQSVTIDLSDARIIKSLLNASSLLLSEHEAIHRALLSKDIEALKALTQSCSKSIANALLALPYLYGDKTIIDQARAVLPDFPEIRDALDQLTWLINNIDGAHVGIDLADLQGYSYYTGMHFSVYCTDINTAVVRGGRYDGVGSIFGSGRSAVGFSFDIKMLSTFIKVNPRKNAIRVYWIECVELRLAIHKLRHTGEIVVCLFDENTVDTDVFIFDRELIKVNGEWLVQSIEKCTK